MTEANINWNTIVQTVRDHKNDPETSVQKYWVYILSSIFGYNWLTGEIKEQEKIHMGSLGKVIPDLLISKDGKDEFVVELKCYTFAKQDKFVEQLKSYMKLLELEIGVLICDKLYLFCRDNGEYPFVEIPFEENNKNGELFVELFNKNNFDKAVIKEFVEEENMKMLMERKRQEEEMRKKLEEERRKQEEISAIRTALYEISADGKNFLKKYFASEFSSDVIEEAFKDIDVYIRVFDKRAVVDQPKPPESVKPKPETGPYPPLGRYDAREYANQHGYSIGSRYTYASINDAGIYWHDINPNWLIYGFDMIWDDCVQKKLYIVKIPANALPKDLIKYKEKPVLKADFKIKQRGDDFIDTYSNLNLSRYVVGVLPYGENGNSPTRIIM